MLPIHAPESLLKPLEVPERILMGPGPSNCSERVLWSLGQPILSHLDTKTLQLMDEIKMGLQYMFQTRNRLTLAISASGHSGMEACISNLLETDETVLIAKCGFWGERAKEMASRLGIRVELLETPAGIPFSLDELEDALMKYRPAAVFVTHGESSTGMKQPLENVGPIVHKYNALLIVDTVASLGAEVFLTDSWGVDAVYTGSQKTLGAPPGLAPISFSPLAERKIFERKSKIPVFYWDMTILGNYWGCFGKPRIYHHTVSATLIYGLREALAQLVEERLPACWSRHAAAAEKLKEGLLSRGLSLYVKNPEHQLSTITTIELPSGVNGRTVVQHAMDKYNVEIAGPLGNILPTNTLRIGVMGQNATLRRVDLILDILDRSLKLATTRSVL